MFSRHNSLHQLRRAIINAAKEDNSTRVDEEGAKVLNYFRQKYEGACRTKWREGTRDRCGSELLCGLMIGTEQEKRKGRRKYIEMRATCYYVV